MSTDNLIDKLTTLFDEAGKAHHAAFAAVDGADPDWPIWYAEYLMDKLPSLLGATFTKSELVYLLVRLSKEQALHAPGTKWPRYYAKFFVEQYT
jgi:hypothetical protein